MRALWVAPWCGLLLAACTGSCAGPTNGVDDHPPPPTSVTRAYIAVDGDDNADGSQSTPFRTIKRGLDSDRDVLIVSGGTYAEAELFITRKVRLEGSDETSAVIDGHVFINANDVQMVRIGVRQGIALNLAERFVVESSTIAAGPKDDAVSIASSSVTLRELSLDCGLETCLQLTTATAAIDGLTVRTNVATKRGIRAESSSVAAVRIDVVGMSAAQVQAGPATSLVLRDSSLRDAGGSGVVAIDRARVTIDNVTISGARRFSLLEQRADVRVRGSTLEGSDAQTIGASAGSLSIFDSVVHGSPEGSINVIAHSGAAPFVRLVRGEVRHGALPGIAHTAGTLRIEGTRFTGDRGAPGTIDDHDSIQSSGIDTQLIVTSATFVDSVGAAIYMRGQAYGTITATITGPRTSGIVVEEARVNPVLIRGGRIDDCVRESGIAIFEADQVTVEDVRISGCTEAGVLAGADTTLWVRRIRAIDNPGFGVGAFGGSKLHLQGSTVRGSQWATFATCADGAQVVDDGDNNLFGATTECP